MQKTVTHPLLVLIITAVLAQHCLSGEIVEDISIESLPPSVIKTLPQCGDEAVDPCLKEISVTFSKEMKVTGHCWSWCAENGSTFPELSGDTKFLEDNRTCVLHVKLEPEKTYAIWVNTDEYHSFQDTLGHKAVPYLLVFKTGSGK